MKTTTRNRLIRARRSLYAMLSAGMLLQASSCAFQPTEVATGLATSLVQSVVSSYVFNFFGLGGP